jgi:hypothetical protein
VQEIYLSVSSCERGYSHVGAFEALYDLRLRNVEAFNSQHFREGDYRMLLPLNLVPDRILFYRRLIPFSLFVIMHHSLHGAGDDRLIFDVA